MTPSRWRRRRASNVDLSVDLGPVHLPNPVIAASGTFGHGAEVACLCDPRALRKGYLDEYQAFTERMKRGCRNNKIDFVPVCTKHPLDVVLSAYLAARANVRAK